MTIKQRIELSDKAKHNNAAARLYSRYEQNGKQWPYGVHHVNDYCHANGLDPLKVWGALRRIGGAK